MPLFSAVKYADKEVKVSEIKAGVRVPVNQSWAVLDCLKKKKKKAKQGVDQLQQERRVCMNNQSQMEVRNTYPKMKLLSRELYRKKQRDRISILEDTSEQFPTHGLMPVADTQMSSALK